MSCPLVYKEQLDSDFLIFVPDIYIAVESNSMYVESVTVLIMVRKVVPMFFFLVLKHNLKPDVCGRATILIPFLNALCSAFSIWNFYIIKCKERDKPGAPA